MPGFASFRRLVPGVLIAMAVTIAAFGLQALEVQWLGHPPLEALVLAILLGSIVRSCWTPTPVFRPGIVFSAKMLLEVAVVLLGLSISAQAVLAVGPALLIGIVGIVTVAIMVSYLIGRTLGLPQRMALLVACGNSICGNSAIAAVAPVIDASSEDVAASIAFTAVLGVLVVLLLPLSIGVWGLTFGQYGVLAGLTVYAVPQVLAATVPISALSTQIGTLVKLIRVLMLGPVVVVLSLLSNKLERAGRPPVVRGKLQISRLVPWFIVGFLVLGGLRSAGLVPDAVQVSTAHASTLLTVLAMAGLGLGVDIREVARAGGRVTMAVVVSLLVLGGMSLALIHAIGVV